MDSPKGRGGSVLNRFALVIVAVIGIGVVAPITATAATAYFSQVKTVTVALDLTNDVQAGFGVNVATTWCPTGYRVTGGGFDFPAQPDGSYIEVRQTIRGSMPTSNPSLPESGETPSLL